MKKIGMISVTLAAVGPMMEQLQRFKDEVAVTNYVDTGLQDQVRRLGEVTDRSLFRLISLLQRAEEDGMDGVLLTCTVFSPFVERIQTLFSFPIQSVDTPMLERAIEHGGSVGVLYTFPATGKTSEMVFHDAEKRLGLRRDLSMIFLEEAFNAAQHGDQVAHDRAILDAISTHAPHFDVLVLAQASMAHVAEQVADPSLQILTSPVEAIRSILRAIDSRERK